MAVPSTTQHQMMTLATRAFNPVNKTKSGERSSSDTTVGTVANYSNIAAIDARLTAISATVYSAVRLAAMTLNDKLYALAVNDDPELRA